jgi:hypothetical protein
MPLSIPCGFWSHGLGGICKIHERPERLRRRRLVEGVQQIPDAYAQTDRRTVSRPARVGLHEDRFRGHLNTEAMHVFQHW